MSIKNEDTFMFIKNEERNNLPWERLRIYDDFCVCVDYLVNTEGMSTYLKEHLTHLRSRIAKNPELLANDNFYEDFVELSNHFFIIYQNYRAIPSALGKLRLFFDPSLSAD